MASVSHVGRLPLPLHVFPSASQKGSTCCDALRKFGLLERFGLHRLPTSVGSGHADPQKTDGAVAASKLKVTWQELLDLLDVAIAEYNAKGQPGLGYRSPLEVLRDHFDRDRQRFVPRPRFPPTLLTPRLGVELSLIHI